MPLKVAEEYLIFSIDLTFVERAEKTAKNCQC